MNLSSNLELDVNELVQEHGLIAILETLKDFVETRADTLSEGDRSSTESTTTLKTVADTLTHLVETLPAEIDVELALVQLTHSTLDESESGEERLAGGLE